MHLPPQQFLFVLASLGLLLAANAAPSFCSNAIIPEPSDDPLFMHLNITAQDASIMEGFVGAMAEARMKQKQ